MTMEETRTSIEEETDARVRPEGGWKVVVHNDPVNLMSYVEMVFRRVFGYSLEKARRHMLEVHEKGRSILWMGEREVAEGYAHALQRWQLTTTLEKDEEG
jgi:ATP-dependent Clp protease adaptor protein ClpS